MTLFGKTIVGLIIIVIGGTGYYFYQNSQSIKTVAEIVKVEATSTAPTGKKIAFSQLMTQNGTYKCTVTQYVQNIETKGIVYMDKGMLRGEFATMVGGQKIDSAMVLKDGYTYSWTSMAPTMGFKTKAVQVESTSTSTIPSGAYSWNADQIGDYNCEAWTSDESKFTLPSTVKFTAVN